MGIEPTTSGLGLPLFCRLSYEVGQRKSGTVLGGESRLRESKGTALVKGIRKPHEAKKKSFDLGGNRAHELRIRSTVTLPTELRDRTEKVKDDIKWSIAAKRK